MLLLGALVKQAPAIHLAWPPVTARLHGAGLFVALNSSWGLLQDTVGAIDVAGGGVIHCTGGAMALAACILLGPRQDQYVTAPGLPTPRRHNSIALQARGCLVLWVGFVVLHAVAGSQTEVDNDNFNVQVCSLRCSAACSC